MLAKEIKIGNLKRQREFIKKQLEKLVTHPREDGNTAYIYVGYIFPEVIEYFEKEERIAVIRVNSESLQVKTNGMPVYYFIPCDIELTEDELKKAEEIEIIEDENEGEDGFLKAVGEFLADPRC